MFDFKIDPVGIEKDVRAVKGVLLFKDLFGEQKYAVKNTINSGIEPKQLFREHGLTVDYNQFSDDQVWVRTSDQKDMVVEYEIEEILLYRRNTGLF